VGPESGFQNYSLTGKAGVALERLDLVTISIRKVRLFCLNSGSQNHASTTVRWFGLLLLGFLLQ